MLHCEGIHYHLGKIWHNSDIRTNWAPVREATKRWTVTLKQEKFLANLGILVHVTDCFLHISRLRTELLGQQYVWGKHNPAHHPQ